jgi:hypothetical protein
MADVNKTEPQAAPTSAEEAAAAATPETQPPISIERDVLAPSEGLAPTEGAPDCGNSR